MANFIKKIFSPEKKHFSKIENLAKQILSLEDDYRNLSDDQLKAKTVEFKRRYDEGETLDDLLVEAFATAREGCYRSIGLFPFYVQLIGGIVMHFGDIAEMKTGEGKTLTSVLPSYLNAISGQGVHIVTVNDYLARRDFTEMGAVFSWLGMNVGLNYRELTSGEKKEAYLCDITYTTNSELGFDYLRDNMVKDLNQRVIRSLNFAVVDEVDSILIDESRTPLIISGGASKSRQLYTMADMFAKKLGVDDYEIDVKTKGIVLTAAGIKKAEKMFNIENIYQLEHNSLIHHINNALKANFIMHNDIDYLVRNREVLIIDQFTGRIMEGRQYSDGLHQAIEAKEGVKINEETRTLATITYQNFFRLYTKLAGMTGTAKTEEEEFSATYNMYVIEVPTNVQVIRKDQDDLIFATKKAKFEALAKEVKVRYEKGQPILIGTVAVETSEEIARVLKKYRVPHEILNAKNHEREADIIAKAGQYKSVTIATNMAGRGTDIKLSEETRQLGGLCVLGSERHESRRIDNQLRGRSGRQGDPGESIFFLSFEDDLLVRFAGPKFKELFANTQGDEALNSKMLSKVIEGSQKRGEGYNYDIRKHLLEYDDVMSKHRNRMYTDRDRVLKSESMKETIFAMLSDTCDDIVSKAVSVEDGSIDIDMMIKLLEGRLVEPGLLNKEAFQDKSIVEIKSEVLNLVLDRYRMVRSSDSENYRAIEKLILISVIDNYWMMHIDTMSKLREGIHLRAYAQKSPIQEYRDEGDLLFDELFYSISTDVSYSIMNLTFKKE